MPNLTPYNRRRNHMRSFIKNFFDDDFFLSSPDFFNTSGLSMRADIRETDKEYIIEADMPGFSKDQIDITVNNGYITIKANRKDIINEEKEGYIRRERRYGTLQRTFRLQNVKEDEIKAKYENGVLKITLPKIKEGKDGIRKIDIN
ncbi:Hsp20/alpha crystallin family protein [Caloranaerobacter ferrireducens]|uniref:Hsp20/alpha crystallin family protein n=1 Tax=Caloranaerobacter ferrireducens TaxID=1323370 RepID=UPI00084DA31E|nr:Hsp20/alpha crystallin family protein [Caloranaerobacter ferrireducens]